MSDDMRGLFFVVKGQYRKHSGDKFVNSVNGDTYYIGGYDPFSDGTEEWYMLMDKKTYHCVWCGRDLNKVLKGVYTLIKKHKGEAKRYFKSVSDTTSEDYYEVHYLGHRPLSDGDRAKKAIGRCPRVSPVMKCLWEKVYEEFGDYYDEEVREMEDLAYTELKEENPVNKSRKLVSKNKPTHSVEIETPKKGVMEEMKPKKITPKVKLGIKKLSME